MVDSPHPRPVPDAETTRRIIDAMGSISRAAMARLESDHEWYRSLAAEDRSWVGLVAQAGVSSFVAWLRDPQAAMGGAAQVFGTAPRELTRSISLAHTLDLLRSAVAVVEDEVTSLAPPAQEAVVREAVLRFSREIAFAAAQVYAEAAEERGAWDARLEALVVDSVLRGVADDSLRSRAAALGWDAVTDVTAVVGASPHARVEADVTGADTAAVIDGVRRAARRLGVQALAGVQGRRLLVILGGTTDAPGTVRELLPHFGPGPVVHGMTVPHLFAAGRSTRSALAGLAAAPAWPGAPRPASSEELLPERAIAGEGRARRALVEHVYRPLSEAGGGLLDTADAFLAAGSLEQAGRDLFVHTNTVRYRLGKVAALTGFDLTSPRDAHAVRLAIALGRLAEVGVAPSRDAYREIGRPANRGESL